MPQYCVQPPVHPVENSAYGAGLQLLFPTNAERCLKAQGPAEILPTVVNISAPVGILQADLVHGKYYLGKYHLLKHVFDRAIGLKF